jgi:aminoglycoside phosphotransferase (APT) family kinase protein
MAAERSAGAFPTAPVCAWLDRRGIVLRRPVTIELISGGRSNLTYSFTGADGRRIVLRRPPFDGVLETAHDMSREWRFMKALGGTPVPVPEVMVRTEEAEPMGAPFYVMSFVEGTVLHDACSALALRAEARAGAAASLMETMASLHQVDIDRVGLGDIAKREDYIPRQLRRWKSQWDQSKSEDIPAVDVAHAQLCREIPPQTRTGIVHGDFRLGNMICGPSGAIRAVLDWELATLGDPMADLGWLLSSWVEPSEWARDPTPGAPPSILPGFPSRDWMLERYERATQVDLSGIDFYIAFAHWRSACIGAGVLARYEAGVMGADGFNPAGLRESIASRAEAALELLRRPDRRPSKVDANPGTGPDQASRQA